MLSSRYNIGSLKLSNEHLIPGGHDSDLVETMIAPSPSTRKFTKVGDPSMNLVYQEHLRYKFVIERLQVLKLLQLSVMVLK